MTDDPYPVPEGHPLQEWKNAPFTFCYADFRTMKPKDLERAQDYLNKIMNGEEPEKE